MITGKPFFSIIIPAYNASGTIERSLESVRVQSVDDYEVIIVDDGSRDDTKSKVEPYLKYSSFKYFCKENEGVSKARNYGSERALGQWLLFLDSDDELCPEALLHFLNAVNNSKSLGFVSAPYWLNGKCIQPNYNKYFPKVKANVLSGSYIVDRNLFKQKLGFDTRLKQGENYELFLRLLLNNKAANELVGVIDYPTLRYHHVKTREQVWIRDIQRASSQFLMYRKFYGNHELHKSSSDFLYSSAVNFVRAGHRIKSAKLFLAHSKRYLSVKSLIAFAISKSGFLSKKVWGR
jgi:glycosyltransferase involved in cell wall biosynthesis